MKAFPVQAALVLFMSLSFPFLSAVPAFAEPTQEATDSAAAGQGKAKDRGPVPSEPHATTASFGDWTLRCQRTGKGSDADPICDVAQSIQDDARGIVAQISLQDEAKPGEMRLYFWLQSMSGITLPSLVKVIDEKDQATLDLAWHRCLPNSCIADEVLPPETLKKWRSHDEQGRIEYKGDSGRDEFVPVSFRGLAQALDALRQK